MNIKVKYMTMSVRDLEESVAFYRDVMGFREVQRVTFPEGFRDHAGHAKGIVLMESDLATVELIENDGMPIGLYSMGTDVDNLEEVIAHLAEHGVELTTPVIETSVGHMAFTKDPNGVNICLIEHDKQR